MKSFHNRIRQVRCIEVRLPFVSVMTKMVLGVDVIRCDDVLEGYQQVEHVADRSDDLLSRGCCAHASMRSLFVSNRSVSIVTMFVCAGTARSAGQVRNEDSNSCQDRVSLLLLLRI
jgi:hypothetical protein